MDPETRPGELKRLSDLANDDPYRFEVLITLNTQKEANKRHEQWMKDHSELDRVQFQNINNTLAEFNSRISGVASGVGDYNDTKAQANGMKRLALWLGGFIVGIVTIAGAMIAIIKSLSG